MTPDFTLIWSHVTFVLHLSLQRSMFDSKLVIGNFHNETNRNIVDFIHVVARLAGCFSLSVSRKANIGKPARVDFGKSRRVAAKSGSDAD